MKKGRGPMARRQFIETVIAGREKALATASGARKREIEAELRHYRDKLAALPAEGGQ